LSPVGQLPARLIVVRAEVDAVSLAQFILFSNYPVVQELLTASQGRGFAFVLDLCVGFKSKLITPILLCDGNSVRIGKLFDLRGAGMRLVA
jgi:hypothetical protein